MITRRSLLTGIASALAAPAVIRTPGLLMPVRSQAVSHGIGITDKALREFMTVWDTAPRIRPSFAFHPSDPCYRIPIFWSPDQNASA